VEKELLGELYNKLSTLELDGGIFGQKTLNIDLGKSSYYIIIYRLY
jgi:hypothetical protein